MKTVTRCVTPADTQQVCVQLLFHQRCLPRTPPSLLYPSLLSPGYNTLDVTQHARQVVQIVELATSMDERLTPLKLVEAWRGRGPAKRRKMIQTTELPRRQAEAVIVFLLLQGYLR